MQKLLYIVLLTLLMCPSSLKSEGYRIQQAQADFKEAGKFFVERKFASSLELFRKIDSSGFGSGELYYNIGNCYYKIGDFGRAILYYERAKKELGENDPDIKNNLDLARLKTKDRIAELPAFFLSTIARRVLSYFPMWFSGTLVLIFFYLLFASLIVEMRFGLPFSPTFKNAINITLSVLLTISLVIFLSKAYQDFQRDEAIILSPTSALKSEPLEKASTLTEIHSGLKVIILNEEQNWFEVRLPNGDKGWINQRDAERI
ncbi:MAG: hypothetical protein SFU91_02255 [Chloroherpetonaceae bacterium]|nr:hypothetical protein [Chloroherpetonaceae bacterium]